MSEEAILLVDPSVPGALTDSIHWKWPTFPNPSWLPDPNNHDGKKKLNVVSNTFHLSKLSLEMDYISKC